MNKRFRYELMAVGIFLLVMGGFFAVALLNARAYVRDDLRRQDITNMKRALEQYYNAHSVYPTPKQVKGAVPVCTHSDDINSWFFGSDSPLVTEQFTDVMPHDTREEQGRVYKYCLTNDVTNGQSFYLQAQLESDYPLGTAFDEDEQRKFHYVILEENGTTLYRVCGGQELQCQSSM